MIRSGLTRSTMLAAVVSLLPCSAFAADQVVQVGPGMVFSPANVSVNPGDMVTWNFNELHTTTSDSQTGPEVWDSGQLSTGTFSHTFNTPGVYPYYCALHSFPGGTFMNGVVEVLGGATPTPTATSTVPTATPTPTATPPSVTPTPTTTSPGVASPTPTSTPPTAATPTPTAPAPDPSATPISGVGPEAIPDLDIVGRALLALALAAAGLAVLLLTSRR